MRIADLGSADDCGGGGADGHFYGLAGAEAAVVVVDLGPDADLAGDRIDLRADEDDFAVEGGAGLAGKIDGEPRGSAGESWPGVLRGQEAFGFEAVDADDSQRLLSRLDPFAEADVDLHDDAVERRDDFPPGDLHLAWPPIRFLWNSFPAWRFAARARLARLRAAICRA